MSHTPASVSEPAPAGLEQSSSLEESSEEGAATRTSEGSAAVKSKKLSIPRSSSVNNLPSFAPPPVPEDDLLVSAPAEEQVMVKAGDDDESAKLLRAATLLQSWRRRVVAQRQFQMQNKRSRVAQELLETEITYVSGLELMIRLYMKPLLASARSTDPIMPRSKVQTIFSVVEVMTNLNKVLLEDLRKRLAAWHADQVLGDIFLAMGDYLKVATQYVNNYETAIKTISHELKTNPRFQLYYNEMRETPECKKNDLKTYLILPVQRIPRYEMLLRELIRKTPANHADAVPLKAAYAKIQAISGLIDSRKDEDIKFREVLRIHSLMDPRVPNLVAPTRRFVNETPFLLLPPKGASSKIKPVPVTCFLFNDLFILADRIEEPPARSSKTIRGVPKATDVSAGGTKRYRPREICALSLIQCEMVNEVVFIKLNDESGVVRDDLQLRLPEGVDAASRVSFVQKYSKARAALESNASSSGLSLRPARDQGNEALPLQRRTPSDPSSQRSPAGPPQTRSEPQSNRRSSGSFSLFRTNSLNTEVSPALAAATIGAVGAEAGEGSESSKTESEISALAEQTKAGTLGVLQEMQAGIKEKMASLEDELAAASDETDRERVGSELQALKLKAGSVDLAIEGQGSMGMLQRANGGRQRSTSEARKSGSGFSLSRGSSQASLDTGAAPSPNARKGLFTIRKKKKDSVGE